MTSEAAQLRTTRRKRLRYTLTAAVAALSMAGCLWSLGFAVLWVSADEGALPPMWRMPDLPPGASVVAQDQECGSGGCNRKITVQPPAGQSPADLAQRMGLTEDLSLRPTLTDPAPVFLGSDADDGRLVIRFGYSGGFK